MNQSCETRSLHYSDSKSDKFWIITLENNQHTVQYGRAGTQGQQQTKEFPTAEKARQSYEKLIREKIAKGYVKEQTQPQTPIVSPSDQPVIDLPNPAVASTIITPEAQESTPSGSSPQPQQPVKSELQETIDLDPKDWFWATWRNLTPLERSKPKPFDLKNCLARLRKVTASYYFWNWSKAKIEFVLSREEAHFWFTAIAEPKKMFVNAD